MSHITYSKLQQAYDQSIQKDGLFNIFLYRKISLYFTALFAGIGFSPNMVTLISFLFVLVSSVFFLYPEKTIILLGLIPFQIGKILDCSDGQLAILTNRKTKLGEFLDPFVDRLGGITVFASLSYSYYYITKDAGVVYLFILWIVLWYIGIYLDNVAVKIKANTGVENLRRTIVLFPFSWQRYIKWDGGFSALLTTVMIIWGNIPLLISIHIIINFLPRVLTLKQVIRSLRTEA